MVINSICRDSSDVTKFLRVVISFLDIQQKDLAKEIHVDASWLSRVLCGSQNLTIDSLFKILNSLEIEFSLSLDSSSRELPSVPYYGLVDDALHAENVSLDFSTD